MEMVGQMMVLDAYGAVHALENATRVGFRRMGEILYALLTRHDANGDACKDDLWRLKGYIHSVGRGRAGNGQYFLAPYPRVRNTVD